MEREREGGRERETDVRWGWGGDRGDRLQIVHTLPARKVCVQNATGILDNENLIVFTPVR